MAKSKSGGTRTYLRGRVGSDVYSIGRDAKGKKQQVVRSLAESVANPQTQAQMRGRMIMSTIAQVESALLPIIDHSFDGLSGARANLAEFVSQNYALIKADAAAHPASGNLFGLSKYGEKGAKRGQYVVSNGQAQLPSALVLTKSTGVIAITMSADAVTIAGLKAALGMTSEEYFTLVGLKADGAAAYERFRINPSLADSTAISAGNIADVFAVEGNAAATIAIASNVISITLDPVKTCCAVIISKKTAAGYIHNKAVLGDGTGFDFASDTALPTYPIGAQNYLNGGDIFGQSESFNPGGGDTPTPPAGDPAVTAVTFGGATLAKGEANAPASATGSLVMTTENVPNNDGYKVGTSTSNLNVGASGTFSNEAAIVDNEASVSATFEANDDNYVYLTRNGVVVEKWCHFFLNEDEENPSDDGD